MATGITDVLDINDNIGTIIAESIIKFQRVNVMWSLMRNKPAPKGSNSVIFPIITTPTKTDVAGLASGAEETDAVITKLSSDGVTVEVLRYAVAVGISDLANAGSTEDMINIASNSVGNALAQKFDNLSIALASGFSTSIGDDTKNITLQMFFNAVQTLKANNAPTYSNGKYAAVLHPKQIWGDYGISNFLTNLTATEKPEEMIGTGYVTSIAGVDIYWSSEVAIATNIASGMIIGPEALAVGWKDMKGTGSFIDIEPKRNALSASSTLVGNGYFAVKELMDTYGVELNTLVTAEA
ncbi:MAG: hypothetical protein U9N34_05210 [Candidatus Cloacimonadota bacterium]|nr:hypothetical protein [Candidatus Cloacimonadota bacterium]